MARTILTRDFYIPKDSTEIKDPDSSAIVYTYSNSSGDPCLKGFGGRRSKPDINFRYSSIEARSQAIHKFFKRIQEQEQYRKDAKGNRKLSESAQVAKLCKQYLKKRGIKCTAKSDNFSMGCSVNISVFDLDPKTKKEIDSEFSQYEYGHFDGMTDMYEMSNVNRDIPQTKYLSVTNHFSDELKQKAWTFARKDFSGADQYPENYKDVPNNARVFDRWVSDLIYQICTGASNFGTGFWDSIKPETKPEPVKPKQPDTTIEAVSEITVRAGTRDGYTEILFPEKPDEFTLQALSKADFTYNSKKVLWWGETSKLPHMFKSKPQDTDDIIEKALSVLEERLAYNEFKMQSPDDTKKYLTLKLAKKEHEIFSVMFLDNRHKLIEYQELFRGTIDGASVYPREVVKEALKQNAAAVIFAHNHPSGEPEPSEQDKRITVRLKKALELVDIRVLDHIVIGGTDSVSFAQRGLI